MIKDTRRFERDAFLAAVADHYRTRGCEVDMKFTVSGEGFAAFAVKEGASGEWRTLDHHESLGALREILFPSEQVRVLSVYKPKHPWFGQEYVYVAIEQEERITT